MSISAPFLLLLYCPVFALGLVMVWPPRRHVHTYMHAHTACRHVLRSAFLRAFVRLLFPSRAGGVDYALSCFCAFMFLVLRRCMICHHGSLLLRFPLTLHEHTPNTARRTNKQIFLSVDVPPTFLSGGGGRTLLEVERAAVGVLRELEEGK